jgi:hypothetical protein
VVRIATFNAANLFARPRAFNTADWDARLPILDADRRGSVRRLRSAPGSACETARVPVTYQRLPGDRACRARLECNRIEEVDLT